MRRVVKIRLVAFVLLSSLAILHIGGTYLGVVDRILGRGYTVHVLLPASGGLYEGSEVTYRGVHVGRVSNMYVSDEGGLRVEVRMKGDSPVPADSPVFVRNLSAVGEQYLSFEPLTNQGPMLADGDIVRGTAESLPVGEEDLLLNLHRFVTSLDADELNTVVTELGTMFTDNATSLGSMVDDVQLFIAEARANETETISLLRDARTVLETQADNAPDIRALARDLDTLSGALASSDPDIRQILDDAAPAADELELLMQDLQVQLPQLLDPMMNVTEVLTARTPALEQLLVTFPRLVAAGPSALAESSTGQKFGRVHLNLNQSPPPCTEGYLPPGQWRPTAEESFVPHFPAECASGAPINMRGMKYAPEPLDVSRLRSGER